MASSQHGSLRDRFRQAADKHGSRGLPFAIAHRALERAEERLNPHHVNRLPTGYTDVATLPVDPIGEVYAAEFQTLVFELPLADLRWSRVGLRLNPDDNPFVRTVVDHLSGTCGSYEHSALRHHYDSWQPDSAAAAVGLSNSSTALGDQHPSALVLPWMAEAAELDADGRLERVDRWNREETRSGSTEMSFTAGHKLFGPVEPAFGRFEYERYTRLADQITEEGFRPLGSDGYVGVQLLVDDGRFACIATGPGLHRTVVAAALGLDPLVVSVSRQPPFVHRSDAAHWPGVRSGLFEVDEALAVFDRIVDGRPPAEFNAGIT